MRKPSIDINIFKERRTQLLNKLGNDILICSSAPECIRNNDVHHPYRQDSSFFYLSGFEEAESVILLRGGDSPLACLFVRPKDSLREVWDGFRYGPDLAKDLFGFDEAFDINEFESKAPEMIKNANQVFYTKFLDKEFDLKIDKTIIAARDLNRRSGNGLITIKDPYSLIGEMRMIKSNSEIEFIKSACEITADSHLEIMKYIKPGMSEREIHGRFIFEFMKRGAAREGYGTIVAGGSNATTLHYVFNDQILNKGEMLLIDGGAEYNYYTGDITRTYPIDGQFTQAQKTLYSKVLGVQKKIINMIRPGLHFDKLQETAIELLTEALLEEGLLLGTVENNVEQKKYLKYYPHGVSHWLGMDVHDAGRYKVDGKSRVLEPGMMFTVEPGLYVQIDDETAPKEFRGIGIRIEDNILVTNNGCENLTIKAPKEIAELESIIGKG